MTPVVQLTHFLRGQVFVCAEIVDGQREWTCPDRPMMRPWPDCYFRESIDQIEALLASQSLQRGRLEDADRHSIA